MRSLLLVLVACGSSPAKPTVDPAVPAADPAPCAAAATNLVQFIDASMPKDKVRDLATKHCIDDKWTVELRKCLLTSTSEKELDHCEQFLTQAQIQSFKTELETLSPANHPIEPAPPVPANGSDVPPAANPMPH